MDKDAHIRHYSAACTPLRQVITLFALFLSIVMYYRTLICTHIRASVSFYFVVLVLAEF